MMPAEVGYTMYDELEGLPGKRRGGSAHMTVTLPQALWQPRVVLWVQALESLTATLLEVE
jgi:hypothetical protein